MDKKVIQRVVVGGVLINQNNKALILQRHNDEDIYPGLWELPSGKREFLEGTEEAVIRELKEEVGVDIIVIKPISVFDYVIEKSDEKRDSTQINFLVKLKDSKQEIKISEEHQKAEWVGLDSIDKFNLTDSTKGVLRKAFELLK